MKLVALLALAVLAPVVAAQTMPAVSAHAAAQALARGAMVVDVRPVADYLTGHLPGAVVLDAGAAELDRVALQKVLSDRGVDLSREVLVVGLPGDLVAQRLQARLLDYATGRVAWLVGGVYEWALSGQPLETGVATLPAVPQYLVSLQVANRVPRMAGSALRDIARPSPITSATVVASPRG